MNRSAGPSVLSRVRASRLFRSGRPRQAFVLSRNRLVWVGESGKKAPAALRGAARPLPEGTFQPGPGGISVAGPLLAKAVSALLLGAGSKPGAASLVIPDAFVRATLLELPNSSLSEREVEEMASWKIARTLGDPPPEVRVAFQPVGVSGAGLARVLAVATPVAAADSWEDAFQAAGVRLGAVESAALAAWWVARHAVGPDGFYVWTDEESATSVFLRGGQLRFLRSRPMVDTDESLHELRLSASFASGDAGEDPVPASELAGVCAAGPSGSSLAAGLADRRRGAGAPLPAELSCRSLFPEVAVEGLDGEDPAVFLALSAMAAIG